MPYAIEITARAGCGCELAIEYNLDDDLEPDIGDVGVMLYGALDDEETGMLDFIREEHHAGGHEKITITARVKLR